MAARHFPACFKMCGKNCLYVITALPVMTRRAVMMMVDSGVETGNEQKAQEEILRQLELVKQGAFDDAELDATVLTINNALKSTVDTLNGLENWYLTQILSGSDESPIENARKVARISKEQIQAAAAQITLDTVFFLAAKKEGQDQ